MNYNIQDVLDGMRCNDEIELRRIAWRVAHLLDEGVHFSYLAYETPPDPENWAWHSELDDAYREGPARFGLDRFRAAVADARTKSAEEWFVTAAPIKACSRCKSYNMRCEMTRSSDYRFVCSTCHRFTHWSPGLRGAVNDWNAGLRA